MFFYLKLSPEPNTKWITDTVALLDAEIMQMHQNVEHGPILLSWMLLNFQIIDMCEEDEKFRKYRQFGTKAVHLGVFGYLKTMICHPMFRVC